VKLDMNFNFSYIPKCPWWTSRNKFWKNSNKAYNSMFFMHSQKIIENYQKLSIFSDFPIFIDLLLPVPCNTTEKREQNSKKIIWLRFFMWMKLMSQIIVRSHFFELLLQIIDDFVVFEVPSFNNSEIRFVIWFFRHSQNVLGELPVSFEKC
jgi:hypothetical protein